jgi:peptidoglycan-associated lipoprotein
LAKQLSFVIFTENQKPMQKIIYILIVFSLIIIPFQTFSQRFLERGDEAFEREQFKLAIDNYQKQFDRSEKSRKTRAEVSYKMALVYMKLSEPEKAIQHFQNALDYNYNDESLYFDLSEAYLQYEEFDKAITALENYKEKVPDNPLTDTKIERIHKTLEALEHPNNYQVKIFALINSGELDFCPFFGYKDFDKLFFTSSRSVVDDPDINLESGELFTDVYEMDRDRRTDAWSVPIKSLGMVNSEHDEGAASLNRRYNVLYFNRCEYDKSVDKGCRIFTAKRRSNYWTEVRELEIPGIPEDISIGHPSISEDELILYFVADSMLGGYGGKDIYKVTRERKSHDFGAPQNLGPDINTVHDDCFPYIRSNEILYFASNGHGSIGGLDIYKAKQLGPSSYDIESMGVPINSPADDFGIVFKDDEEEGYFTSRRRGGVGKSDIYHFILPEVTAKITGVVWGKFNNEKLPEVHVSLCDQEGNEISNKKTNEFGEFEFDLNLDDIYQIYFTKEPYIPESIRVSTKGLNTPTTFKREIFLDGM